MLIARRKGLFESVCRRVPADRGAAGREFSLRSRHQLGRAAGVLPSLYDEARYWMREAHYWRAVAGVFAAGWLLAMAGLGLMWWAAQ